MSFKDHFSQQAADYARFRPRYPRALFEWIATNAPDDRFALDCATGNGQAALALSEFFQQVIALDASAQQIRNALPNERVEYRVASAEATGLPDHCCAAITAAQALHWFDLGRFYAEAKRVLEPGGVLAVWSYDHLQVNPAANAIIRRFHDEIVGPFWPVERKLVGRGICDLPFPFAEIQPPAFRIEVRWTLPHLLGYLGTWSATQRFRAVNGTDPVELIAPELARIWGSPDEQRLVTWPLICRIGRP